GSRNGQDDERNEQGELERIGAEVLQLPLRGKPIEPCIRVPSIADVGEGCEQVEPNDIFQNGLHPVLPRWLSATSAARRPIRQSSDVERITNPLAHTSLHPSASHCRRSRLGATVADPAHSTDSRIVTGSPSPLGLRAAPRT